MNANVGELRYVKVAFPAGANVTKTIDLGGQQVMGLTLGPTWTPAGIYYLHTVEVGETEITVPVVNSLGTEVAVPAAANKSFTLGVSFSGLRFIKLGSGTSAAPVNQVAESWVTLALGYR